MKAKDKAKDKAKEKYGFGVILIAAGVVFMMSVSKGLGVAFIALGGLFMIMGAKDKK